MLSFRVQVTELEPSGKGPPHGQGHVSAMWERALILSLVARLTVLPREVLCPLQASVSPVKAEWVEPSL